MIALPMLPPLTGVAISQSVVDNNQNQSGELSSSQTLNVVDVSQATSGVTSATGNSLSGAVTSGTLAVTNTQSLTGDVTTSTTLNVTTNAGPTATLNTASTGNTSDIESVTGGGAITGSSTQTVGAVNVTATSSFAAGAAQTGAMSTGTQAIANSLGLANQDTSVNVTTVQTSAAQTESTDGGSLMYTPGTAAYASSAVSNNLTGAGTGNASQTINATQTMTGALTQAGEFSYLGNAQSVSAAATASDNNISISNNSGSVNLTDSQSNTSYTRAQTDLSSYEFGSGQATAYGVGNSTLVANVGSYTGLDNTQSNTGGGIEVISGFTGNNGYDATSSATAMGNAVTAFSCSDCGGVINISNSQTNTAGVSATSTLSITGSNQSVTGISTAVGNNATFYVSKPSH